MISNLDLLISDAALWLRSYFRDGRRRQVLGGHGASKRLRLGFPPPLLSSQLPYCLRVITLSHIIYFIGWCIRQPTMLQKLTQYRASLAQILERNRLKVVTILLRAEDGDVSARPRTTP